MCTAGRGSAAQAGASCAAVVWGRRVAAGPQLTAPALSPPAGEPRPHAQRPPSAHAEQHPVPVLRRVGHHHPGPGDPDAPHAERGQAAVEEALSVPLRRKAGACPAAPARRSSGVSLKGRKWWGFIKVLPGFPSMLKKNCDSKSSPKQDSARAEL